MNGFSKSDNTWMPWTLLCSRLLTEFLMLMKAASESVQRQKKKKVISITGGKHVYSTRNSTQQQVTVLACSSAVWQYIPPLLIFPYTRNPRFNVLEGFEDALFQKKNQQQQQQQKNPMDGLRGGLSQLPERRLHCPLGRKMTSGAVCGWSFQSSLPGHHYFVYFQCCFDCC